MHFLMFHVTDFDFSFLNENVLLQIAQPDFRLFPLTIDKISVIFLVNIILLIISLKINLLQTLKETFRFIWAFLTVHWRFQVQHCCLACGWIHCCSDHLQSNTLSLDFDLFLHQKQGRKPRGIVEAFSTRPFGYSARNSNSTS